MILVQNNIFRSRNIESQPISAYYMVTVILLCSQHTRLLQVQNVNEIFVSFDL